MLFESASTWPIRIVADPKWIRTNIWCLDGTLRHPGRWLTGSRWDARRVFFLYRLVRTFKPKLVVETGVHWGKTTVGILSGLRKNGTGRLISIDLPKKAGSMNSDGRYDAAHVERDSDTGRLVPRDLRDIWDLRLGTSRDLLPDAIRGADMLFHDSEHSFATMAFEYGLACQEMTGGGVIASDDTGFSEGAARAWKELLDKNEHVGLGGPTPGDGMQAIFKGTRSDFWRAKYRPGETA
jgi:hypothetical protein